MRMIFRSWLLCLAVTLFMSGCALLRRGPDGSSPSEAILLDTIDLDISEHALLPYNIAPAIEIDIHHVELDLRFDWEKEEVLGKAKLRLSAFFDPTDTIVLNARGFEIKDISYSAQDTVYTPEYLYDRSVIRIIPEKRLNPKDTVGVTIKYIARPTKLENAEGKAITSDQGLYFINPKGEDPDKPRQIWSQGEPECNSAWFPSVDHPHEKFTQEIFLTVDSAYHTISNGKKMYASLNEDGTRTDYWKQDKPHANYLVMIAVGEFSLVKNSWKGRDVWYYLDKEYRPYAQDIFGNTPEMLSFYSSLLAYDYPWEKYHQIVVKDFVSGAMENTSAVIHGDFVQLTDRELLDDSHEDVIAHELFHHWFGDLVTCRSWSQLTMNEGFATYGEYLWAEHKYGIEQARYQLQNDLDAYLREADSTPKRLIRHHYNTPDDVFDSHTYQKGGRVLHMLRLELGDTAFFATLSHYLKKHAYQSADVDDFRHAVYEVTGRDLSWFFDQWYRESGHPLVSVSYKWNEERKTLTTYLEQVQDNAFPVFKMHVPLLAGLADGSKKESLIWLDGRVDSNKTILPSKPIWYAVDPSGDMLWEVQEEKPADAWKAQLKNGPSFITRQNALFELMDADPEYLVSNGQALLKDPFWLMRGYVLEFLATQPTSKNLRGALIEMAQLDEKSLVRAAAFATLDSLYSSDTALTGIFLSGVHDQSYGVIRSCLSVLLETGPCAAAKEIGFLEKEQHGSIQYWVSRIYANCPDLKYLKFFESTSASSKGLNLFLINNDFTAYAMQLDNDRVYESLVKSLAQSAWNSESWWARYSAVQGLGKVQEFYATEIERLEAAPEETLDETERLVYLRNQKASLAAMLEEINELEEPEDSPFRD